MSFSPDRPARVGLIGAGNIARRYVEGMSRFSELELVAVTDAIPAAARALALEAHILAYDSLASMLADDAIDVVVNITPPTVHASVTRQALAAGKHVYSEKPIADSVDAALECVAEAARTGKTFGVAPDTFLGTAGQSARRAIDDGLIGEPIAASMFITHSRAETWHPDPTFLFQPGGGPLLDLGPYYFTAIVNLLGPVESVAGFTRIGAPTRKVTSPDRRVDSVSVTTPTHATAAIRLRSGVLVTAMLSFDVWDANLPPIEIYGTEATISLPDPNEFDGPVRIRRHGDTEWSVIPAVGEPSGEPGSPTQLLRGYGVADLVHSLDGEPLRASADLALHVLETLDAIQRSSDTATLVRVSSTVERPKPVHDAVRSGTGQK